MTIIMKSKIRDLLSFIMHLKKRNRIFKTAKTDPMPDGKINELAMALHPHQQEMEIISIIEETADTKTYRLKMTNSDNKPAYFRAGQYISCLFNVENSSVFRPFSISSRPEQVKTDGTYDLTIKKTNDGFISRWLDENWNTGRRVNCSGPAGDFYYQELRDQKILVCLGGGSGITPFKSIIPDILTKYPNVKVILLHGAVNSKHFIFKQYFSDLQENNSSRFFYTPVCSDPDREWKGKAGFISAAVIQNAIKEFAPESSLNDCSFFQCGSSLMVEYINMQLTELHIKSKNIRKENYAVNNLGIDQEYSEFELIINMNTKKLCIKARSNETILVAMERAGLNPPSLCRSGSCGWCRSRLINGKVLSPAEINGLRQADKKFGFIHPCCEFPASDLELYVPDNTIKNIEE